MRHFFIIENAVLHNFAIQIALIQYSGRSKHFDLDKLGKIPRHHWEKRIQLVKTAKFESDSLKK